MQSNSIRFLRVKRIFYQVYPKAILSLRLCQKAIAKPQYILLCCWAFKQLSWVDRDLKQKAIAAIQNPPQVPLQPLTADFKQEIKKRAIAIFWTAKIHPLRPKCLHRSLVLYHWLQEQGLASRLEIGWSNGIAHAWLTYGDLVLNDRPDIAKLTSRLDKVAVISDSI